MNAYHKILSKRIMGTNYCRKFRPNANLYFEMLVMYDKLVEDSPHKCCHHYPKLQIYYCR